jgi:H+-transporting ATPase
MEIAVLLAAGLRDWIDFGVIIAILLLNAIVGWYQEKQAADVVASLKGDIAMRTTVVRDGQEQEIKARELVPGDIIIIEDGQVVPADARIISAYDNPNGYAEYQRELEKQAGEDVEHKGEDDDEMGEKHGSGYALLAIDQSAMTGESLAVDKCRIVRARNDAVGNNGDPSTPMSLPFFELVLHLASRAHLFKRAPSPLPRF